MNPTDSLVAYQVRAKQILKWLTETANNVPRRTQVG